MDKTLKPRRKPLCHARTVVAESKLFGIEQLELEFANGAKRQYERLVRHSTGAVLVVPLLDSETVILIREYAAGIERYELGFPKGLIEQGETVFEAANREMKEEIGYGAKQFKELKAVSSSPAYFGMMVNLVVAEELYPETLEGDEPEPIEVIPWPIAKLDELLTRDDFTEARSIAAIYLLKHYLGGKI